MSRLSFAARRHAVCAFAAGLALSSAGAQEILHRVEPAAPSEWLGRSVAAMGDVNGDGVPDFAVSGTVADKEMVRVFDGSDASALYTLESVYPPADFGADRNLVGVGDVDGDGVPEFAVGVPWAETMTGLFEIYRGSDGEYLRTHVGGVFDSFGSGVAALGDVDGDDVPDYAACTFGMASGGGYTVVYSGAAGEELARLTGREPFRFWSLAGVGDLDGDGKGDLGLGLWSEDEEWKPGQVRVLSGALFGDPVTPAGTIDIDSPEALAQTLLHVDGRRGEGGSFESLGMGLNGLGDIDGDGVPDVGAGTGPSDDAVVLSGADGSRLHEWTSDKLKLFSQLVVQTEGVADTNGDGVRDVVVGRTGSVQLRSGLDGSLLAEQTGPGDLGEEIAAIGDLDGDGVSEILASAPDGGYALVLSFGPAAARPSPGDRARLRVLKQKGAVVVTWEDGLADATLEQSPDLVDWQTVQNVSGNFHLVPADAASSKYYRLRFADDN